MTTSTAAPAETTNGSLPRAPTVTMMKVADIKVREGFNAREGLTGIDQLAGSIQLLGILVPLIVDSDGYLIDGHRRRAAAELIALEEAPVTFQQPTGTDPAGGPIEGVAAVTNIVRQQLIPAEEATAIKHMLDNGYTAEGAAQALGMPLARVTRRLELLKIPVPLRDLWGPGGSARLDVVPAVVALVEKIPELADSLLTYHLAGRSINALAERDPAWFLHQMINVAQPGGFNKVKGLKVPKDFALAQEGTRIEVRDLTGKAAERLEELIKEAGRIGMYGELRALNTADIDAARAAGVTVDLGEGDDRRTYVCSLSWIRERAASDLIPRLEKTVEDAKAKNARAKGRTAKAKAGEPEPQLSPHEIRAQKQAVREREAGKRWKGLAPGANLDLGQALLNNLADVEVTVDVARFFAEAVLGGRETKVSPYVGGHPGAITLAVAGLRYVMPGWQTEKPKPTRADPKKTVTEYLDQEQAAERLWKWFDQAKTPGEILGKALIIHAAARWAVEDCIPRAQRGLPRHSKGYCGRYVGLPDASRKALEKICKPVLPASVKKLIRDIENFDPMVEADGEDG